ncbi:MAG: T9SS type A sorting domain-containing protein [Flavobacteriales bacterium]|nr:T9SS type A sorting domain-containing protein [Flavobacteriales bacterium]
MKYKFALLFIIAFIATLSGQPIAEKQVIQLNTIADETNTQLKLTWPLQASGTSLSIYRRDTLGAGAWGSPIATLMLSDSTYTDQLVEIGKGYEYKIESAIAYGYIYSGIKLKANHQNSGCVLVIDSSYSDALSFELDQLENDLKNDGWNPARVLVGRNEPAPNVRNKIMTKRAEMDNLVDAVILIGHVPVPYSGDFSKYSSTPPPDGHVEGSGNHTGAWPTDGYYGDVDGSWTDAVANRTTGNQTRHHNVPFDGKFDQSKFPSELELQVGRIDLYDMGSFSASDTQLLKNYFKRNHLWRTGQSKTIERALVDNNFTGLNLASTGYHNFSSFFPFDSISKTDYFTGMKNAPYMWSYGCGAGSYTSCNGVGNTGNFAADSLQSIFTILAGSFFGDWDVKNNLLRAPLANSALVSFWGGIPKWYIHSMAMGKHIGEGTRASQNNTSNYFNGNFNGSYNGVYIALMGDPTLTMRPFAGASNLTAASAENKVSLNWNHTNSSNKWYYVYRIGDFRTYTLLTPTPISDNSFVDSTNRKSGNVEYVVRATRIDTTASGTFANLSVGVSVEVDHVFDKYVGLQEAIESQFVELFPNPGKGSFQLNYNSNTSSNATLRIVDLGGRIIRSVQLPSQTGQNSKQLEFDLQPGVYSIELMNGVKRIGQSKYVVTY